MQDYKFDGVDIDWLYPTIRRGFVKLVKECRYVFDDNKLGKYYLITIAVSGRSNVIQAAYNARELNRFDFHIIIN